MCERAYLKYAQGVVIPPKSSADPLKEFKATDVKNKQLTPFVFSSYVTQTSTPHIRVVLDHPRTPPRSRQGFWSRVEGRGSRVEGRGSRVEGRGSRVEGRGSRVEGKWSRVEGNKSRVEKFFTITFECRQIKFRVYSSFRFLFYFTLTAGGIMCRCNTRVNNIEY